MTLSNLINDWMKTHPPAADADKRPPVKNIKKPQDLPVADLATTSQRLSDPRPDAQPTPVAKSAGQIGMNRPHVRIWRNRT